MKEEQLQGILQRIREGISCGGHHSVDFEAALIAFANVDSTDAFAWPWIEEARSFAEQLGLQDQVPPSRHRIAAEGLNARDEHERLVAMAKFKYHALAELDDHDRRSQVEAVITLFDQAAQLRPLGKKHKRILSVLESTVAAAKLGDL